MKCFSVFLLLVCAAYIQAQHNHHSMMRTFNAQLDLKDDSAAQVLTIRIGPLNLPAKTNHADVAQAPELFLKMPFDGWITAYHPRLISGSGQQIPSRLLHHVAFYNTARADFLCPNKQEHIFGAGGEMNDWPTLPGYGYPVHQSDRIRISTMFHNPTPTNYPEAWLEVKLEYRSANKAEALQSVYPAWFDAGECGNSGYDLGRGRTLKMGQFKLAFSGVLLGVGGHMHDFGLQLDLYNLTRGEDVAALKTELDPSGRILSIPIVRFTDRGGYKLRPSAPSQSSPKYLSGLRCG